MDILDFGAGPGWVSHALATLGARTTLVDVSASALRIAAARFEQFPIPVAHTPPQFSHFNGRTFDLPDQSFDAVVSFDAFHHVPNPNEVLIEMGRILREGGVAAFVEPGPQHSWSTGSQYEMRHHSVVENDVVIENVWSEAKTAGFTDLRVSIFGVTPFHVSLAGFNDFLSGGATADQALASMHQYMMHARRLFFLRKGDPRPDDSRSGHGLTATIRSSASELVVSSDEIVKLTMSVRNTGTSVWLPSSHGVGSVWLGMHLYSDRDRVTTTGYFTQPLPIEDTNGLLPEASVQFEVEIGPLPGNGDYTMEFDLVSQQVTWFQSCGSKTTAVAVRVGR